MSEALRFINYIERAKFQINVLGEYSNTMISELIDGEFWNNIKEFERPDIQIKLQKKVLLLEHFEFNSSKLVRGSSLEHKKIAELDRELDKMSLRYKGEPIVISKELENEASTKSYIDNLLRNSNKHIEKYDDYIKNFNESTKNKFVDKIEFGFVIENTSSLYDAVIRDGTQTLIFPFNIKEFLEFLKKNDKVKHVFSLSRTPDSYVIYYFYNNANSINALMESIDIITEKDELLYPNPQSISARAHFK
jgi:hypothetical protein